MKKIAGLALVMSMAATSVFAQDSVPNPCKPQEVLGLDGLCRIPAAPGVVIGGGLGGGAAIGLVGLLVIGALGGGGDDDDGGGGSSSSTTSATSSSILN